MKVTGKVLRANDYGLYVIRDIASNRQYVFTADKLDSFRQGQVGVSEGAVVTVTIENDKVVAATKG